VCRIPPEGGHGEDGDGDAGHGCFATDGDSGPSLAGRRNPAKGQDRVPAVPHRPLRRRFRPPRQPSTAIKVRREKPPRVDRQLDPRYLPGGVPPAHVSAPVHESVQRSGILDHARPGTRGNLSGRVRRRVIGDVDRPSEVLGVGERKRPCAGKILRRYRLPLGRLARRTPHGKDKSSNNRGDAQSLKLPLLHLLEQPPRLRILVFFAASFFSSIVTALSFSGSSARRMGGWRCGWRSCSTNRPSVYPTVRPSSYPRPAVGRKSAGRPVIYLDGRAY
jgi:hypothetical protein